MARYWRGIAGGIPLEESPGIVAGFQLEGAEAFAMGNITGNSAPAADGTPQFQYVPLYHLGEVLEIEFLHVPQTLLNALLTLCRNAIATDTGFACSLTDDFQTIEGVFKPNIPAWYSRGEPDGAYIKDAVIRLIYVGA